MSRQSNAAQHQVRFHAVGCWSPGHLSCTWTASTFSPPAEVLGLIERTWAKLSADTSVQLFDGPMCRLERFEARPDLLELCFSRISYKPFVGTNLHHAELADRFGPAAMANPLGVSCALVSADDYLMLGRRNRRVAYYPLRIHPFAGALEPAEPMDIFAEVRRELDEELSLKAEELGAMRVLGLVEDRLIRQPELVVLVEAMLPREQIERRLNDQEHEGSCALASQPDALASLIDHESELTPVGTGTVALWGRTRFGDDWFEAVRKRISPEP